MSCGPRERLKKKEKIIILKLDGERTKEQGEENEIFDDLDGASQSRKTCRVHSTNSIHGCTTTRGVGGGGVVTGD